MSLVFESLRDLYKSNVLKTDHYKLKKRECFGCRKEVKEVMTEEEYKDPDWRCSECRAQLTNY